MTSQTGKQLIKYIHIAQHLNKQWQSDNVFFLLTEYNMRNIFLKKSFAKCETSPFLKN